MTLPDMYRAQGVLELGIIQEYYPVDESAEIWVQEDIMNYGTDYRVHIIRTDDENKEFISNACKRYNIDFRNHTSEEDKPRGISPYINNITNHLVIAIKGFTAAPI
jgi:hypothetical protein